MPQDRAPSREKGQPLCMAQYQRLFTSYRAPGLDKDQLKSLSSEENEHIIVAHQGQVYHILNSDYCHLHDVFTFIFFVHGMQTTTQQV